MGTKIRPVLSRRNKYYIDKHRYYELKHFCMQYDEWVKTYNAINNISSSSSIMIVKNNNMVKDNTADIAIRKCYYLDRINMVEAAAKFSDEELYKYIIKAVTKNLPYESLDIPLCRSAYYERYRKFFYKLNILRK